MKYKPKPLTLILLFAALLWGIEMFRLSGQTAEVSSGLSMRLICRVLDFLRLTGVDPATLDHPVRKLAHVIMFAIEGGLLTGGLLSLRERPAPRCVLIAAAVCAALAVLTEWVQTLSEGRSCELRDMLLDFGGAIIGIALACLIAKAVRARRAGRPGEMR